MTELEEPPSTLDSTGPEPIRFHATSCIAWLAGAMALSLIAAWLTVLVEPFFAPLVVFPLLVGFILGLGLVGWMRVCGMAHRKSVGIGVVVTVAAFVVAAHYFAYARVQQQFDEQFAQLQQSRPDLGGLVEVQESTRPHSMVSFLRQTAERGRPLLGYTVRGAGVWLWWGLDAGLTLVGTVAPVWIALRRPYCPRCRSWYRVVRSGPIDRETACEIATCLKLPQATAGRADYRLLSCRAGCAKSAFELSWDESPANARCMFLDAPQRDAVMKLLDQMVIRPSTEVGQDSP